MNRTFSEQLIVPTHCLTAQPNHLPFHIHRQSTTCHNIIGLPTSQVIDNVLPSSILCNRRVSAAACAVPNVRNLCSVNVPGMYALASLSSSSVYYIKRRQIEKEKGSEKRDAGMSGLQNCHTAMSSARRFSFFFLVSLCDLTDARAKWMSAISAKGRFSDWGWMKSIFGFLASECAQGTVAHTVQ